MRHKDHILGVDGGGSGTRCVIADFYGNIIARGVGGPSNPLTAGAGVAAENILEAIRKTTKMHGVNEFEGSIMGIAGTNRPTEIRLLKEKLTGFDFGNLRIVSDAKIALSGATGCKPGIIVISGTGSIAFGVNEEGKEARAGGWGWRLGDEGSAYDLGHKAMIAGLRDFDGRGPPTILTENLKMSLKIRDLSELVDLLYKGNMGSKDVAALAPLVSKSADTGDQVALEILDKAGEELGIAAAAVIKRLELEGQFLVAMNQGIVNISGVLRESLEKRVKQDSPNCVFIEPRFPPEVGAILLALKDHGVDLDSDLLERLEISLNELMEGSI